MITSALIERVNAVVFVCANTLAQTLLIGLPSPIWAYITSPTESGPLAQIVSWIWERGAQKNEKTRTLDRGETAEINCFNSPSIVIRILEKQSRTRVRRSALRTTDLTAHIGDRKVTVSAHWLIVSPVVKRMLSVEMKEKQQRTHNLDGHDITMEQFMQFLETVNDFQHATNVLALLKLADYFQIDWLKERCEALLINSVEIPLLKRFFLIESYRLDNLKANHQQLLSSISKDFWFDSTFWIFGSQFSSLIGP
uniref:BTB domain-containing protein n=1 Tax=Globodera rostochiensis TaxID=31243 RepID=A0A914GUY7_GLORO